MDITSKVRVLTPELDVVSVSSQVRLPGVFLCQDGLLWKLGDAQQELQIQRYYGFGGMDR